MSLTFKMIAGKLSGSLLSFQVPVAVLSNKPMVLNQVRVVLNVVL